MKLYLAGVMIHILLFKNCRPNEPWTYANNFINATAYRSGLLWIHQVELDWTWPTTGSTTLHAFTMIKIYSPHTFTFSIVFYYVKYVHMHASAWLEACLKGERQSNLLHTLQLPSTRWWPPPAVSANFVSASSLQYCSIMVRKYYQSQSVEQS